MRVSLFVLLLAAAGLLAADLQPSPASSRTTSSPTRELALARPVSAPRTVEIALVRNGWVARVEREAPRGAAAAQFALRQLLEGPTLDEQRRGLRTAFPKGSRLRSVRSTSDTWLVSLSRSAFESGTAETRRLRLWQVAATLAPLGAQEHVAVALAGRLLTVQRLGVRPAPLDAVPGENDYRYSLRGVQRRLVLLGYLEESDVSGVADYATEQALLAFQGWEGLYRSGTLTGQTQIALFDASRPRAKRIGAGKRVEIYRDPGVLLLVEDGEVVRAVHTSTGAGGLTPVGDFRVYVKSLMSWSVPFQVWMPYAAYFRGGIAMHQSPDVPSYPASHGCVRLPEGEADRVYRWVEVGTPVYVR